MSRFETGLTKPTLLREGQEISSDNLPEIIEAGHPEEQEFGPEENIYCRQCHQVISSDEQRIIREGTHEHTFANPNGLIFNIACFRLVTGCAYAGTFSQEFTWFTGYQWRIVICTMCLTHLGWLFVSGGADCFHGLIIDRLIEPETKI